tara:strand:+ start:213 stop:593 length:381 start_codon:yes stop_codon:yes gene_type:complete
MKHSIKLSGTSLLLCLLAISGHKCVAGELRIPRLISCSKGSVTINQISPADTYELTKTAAFRLTVNGTTENATGIENGNFTKVTSQTYYVYGGTGGLTFGRNSSSGRRAICTNSKYGKTTPGFRTK